MVVNWRLPIFAKYDDTLRLQLKTALVTDYSHNIMSQETIKELDLLSVFALFFHLLILGKGTAYLAYLSRSVYNGNLGYSCWPVPQVWKTCVSF